MTKTVSMSSNNESLFAVLSHPKPEVVAQVQGVVERVCRRFAIPLDDRDDFQQDVWVSISRHLQLHPQYPRPHHVEAWLYTFVRRRAIDWIRSTIRKRRQVLMEIVGTDQEPELAGGGRELELLWHKEVLHDAWNEVQVRLNKRNFYILDQTWRQQRPDQEIAGELGLTIRQLQRKRSRALKTFRKLVAKRM